MPLPAADGENPLRDRTRCFRLSVIRPHDTLASSRPWRLLQPEQWEPWALSQRPKPATAFLRTITMHDLHPIPRLAQQLADVFGDHHAAMLAARASEADGQ